MKKRLENLLGELLVLGIAAAVVIGITMLFEYLVPAYGFVIMLGCLSASYIALRLTGVLEVDQDKDKDKCCKDK